ncbi:unnamed protein product [Arctia plantaginis]|uniref:Uncharacterized protein n=1 Tax=Arctia plantaginis TaxID=874455 RepID=A0A8S0ZLT7_ARCPL|nr:unnamed protein product [Arctia plantaginis]CAB3238372.1 unnamed protein product [Arctia plantaginis]
MSPQQNLRFDKLEQCSSLAIATALDPRFKVIHFKDATAKGKVINYINYYLMSNLTNAANESSDESEKGDNTESAVSGGLLLFAAHVTRGASCPWACSCRASAADCAHRGLLHVPKRLPTDSHRL